MRSSLMRRECSAVDVDIVWPSDRFSNGEMHQSAPSAVALTDEAWASPEQNSIPALTHLQDRAGSRRDCIDGVVRRLGGDVEEEKDGVAPVKMTRPP